MLILSFHSVDSVTKYCALAVSNLNIVNRSPIFFLKIVFRQSMGAMRLAANAEKMENRFTVTFAREKQMKTAFLFFLFEYFEPS